MRPPPSACLLLAVTPALITLVSAIEPYQIQGSGSMSPHNGKTLTGIHGVVTAKGPKGWWIQGASDGNDATSDAVYVFTEIKPIRDQVAEGDEILFDGKVVEFRFNGATGLYLTEVLSPSNLVKLSTGNVVKPIILGEDRSPPTTVYSALDEANGGVFGPPGGRTYSAENATAEPDKFGLDFWSSLDGQLVTIKSPVVLGPGDDRQFWVHGTWPVTGKNARGGLTMTIDANGVVDANPEAIQIGSPLAGPKNPKAVAMGSRLSDITGIVTFVVDHGFDFWRVLPLTAPTVISHPSAVANPTELISIPYDATSKCQKVTFGSYNVMNLSPSSRHRDKVARQIVGSMRSPDLLLIQEVMDDDGTGADVGVVSSERNLAMLVQSIVNAGGPRYSWAVVDPVNNQDGGAERGNIRVATLYRAETLKLVSPNPGSAIDATEVKVVNGRVELSLNPGRIDPTNECFNDSRKPLATLFEAIGTGERLLVINVHQASKPEGSTSLHGDPRPPLNGKFDQRVNQAKVTAKFIASVLAADPASRIIIGGDFNEFGFVKPAFDPYFANGMLEDADEVVNIPPLERYTYVFNQNSEQLDHILVSKEVAKTLEYEHLHVNTWAPSIDAQTSDHDPSVGRLELCASPTDEPLVRRVTEEL